MTMVIDGSNGLKFPDNTNQQTAIGYNRIINGAMMIDQRNAGASVTQTTSSVYTVDRWLCYGTAASKFTVQQNAGSVTPPAGYKNYLGVTSSSAYSVASGDALGIAQLIEGLNVADLGWGTASAQSITVSFWVRSSLTGAFGGAIQNSLNTRSYPFTYTISSANTWEQKSITIVGDTTGTWLTTNGIGLQLLITMGAGSTYSGTAGAWVASNIWQPTGSTSVVGTNGATFYITGVQLEKGTTATSFDYRPYGTELALCQRYYQIGPSGAAGRWNSSTTAEVAYSFRTQMRATPTVTHLSNYSASEIGVAGRTITNTTISGITEYGGLINIISSGATIGSIAGVTGSGAGFSAEL